MLKKAKSYSLVGVILSTILLIAIIFTSILYFIASTTDDANEQNQQYLKEIAVQNAALIKSKVDGDLETLDAISNIIGCEEQFSEEEVMKVLNSEGERRSFKRLGFVLDAGEVKTTDGTVLNILDRKYYKKALYGESNISDKLEDRATGGYINVYAVPLYHESVMEGVIIATNATEQYSDLLSIDSFSGEGFSYIIKKNGNTVIYPKHKNGLEEFENIFDEMLKNGADEADVESMKDNMDSNLDGVMEYTRCGIENIGAYSRVGVNDWYVVSVVPKDIIFRNTNRLLHRNLIAVTLVATLFLILLTAIFYISKKNHKELERLAYVDELTGCNNLNKFKLLVKEALDKYTDEPLFMARIDIDNFKLINDMYGFSEGDTILKDIVKIIDYIVPKSDVYARIGNDDFILLLRTDCEEDVLAYGLRFRNAFKYMYSGKGYNINFTTGVYKIEKGETDVAKIIDRTTMAHRNAKTLNGDRKYSFFNDKIRQDAVKIKMIEDNMHESMKNNEFAVYLQPKYEMSTNEMKGAEALIRWIKDDIVIPPSEFIPIFEKNGFVAEIDMFVLESVCKLQRGWIDQNITPVTISVNQSQVLISSKDYIEKLHLIIKKYNIPPNLIELELTETVIHNNIDMLRHTLIRLKEIGFLISIDDFGSGYSSLNMLKEIHADVVKIDREFLNKLEDNERGQVVLSNIIQLAKKLQMSVVCEGVETIKQAELLQNLECNIAQGFLYARPMPVSEFEKRL
ncbi:MAG: EAL domain-containing protein [Oscillospiraceae bacterium]